MKYHRFLHHEIEKYKGKKSKKQLRRKSASKNPDKGFLRPEIRECKKEETVPQRIRIIKSTNSVELSLPCMSWEKSVVTDTPSWIFLLPVSLQPIQSRLIFVRVSAPS